MSGTRELIDWSLAARVASTVSGARVPTSPAERSDVWRDLLHASARAQELVAGFTGLAPATTPADPQVLGRAAWVHANIDTFRSFASSLGERLPTPPVGHVVAATALGVQLGAVLGYVSQRVLGQYDVFGATGGLYYIGPNIVAFERKNGLDPAGFRLWIALHEVTHRVQFSAVPWLGPHVRGIIDRATATVEADPKAIPRAIGRLLELAAAGPQAWRDANIVELITTPEQRALLSDVRALMSLIEGHASWVMNGAGRGVVPGLEQMRAAAAHRREDVGGFVPRMLGIGLKLEQYKMGEDFCDAVEAEAGREAVNLAWRSPADVPTFEELKDARAWLARVGA